MCGEHVGIQDPADRMVFQIIGGTAGCILASRLADADPGFSILLIEHGSNNEGNPLISHPLLWRAHLLPQTGTTIYYVSKSETQLAERVIPVASGGILGGGSSINIAIYTRPQGIDYDAWNVKGWSAADLRPFMNKVSGMGLFPRHWTVTSDWS